MIPTETVQMDQFMKNQPLVGEYFTYQRNMNQPKWVSYNLYRLIEICKHDGGVITDSEDNIIFLKLNPNE